MSYLKEREYYNVTDVITKIGKINSFAVFLSSLKSGLHLFLVFIILITWHFKFNICVFIKILEDIRVQNNDASLE